MNFIHQWNFKSNDFEKGGGEKLVETQGYIPEHIRIEQMILAGARLDEIRKSQYDSDNLMDGENIEDFSDPSRSPGFDIVDAQTIMRQNREKMKAFQKQQAEAKASAAKGSGEEQLPQSVKQESL